MLVGALLGRTLGARLTEGVGLGATDGIDEGLALGSRVLVGLSDGEAEGICVGGFVGRLGFGVGGGPYNTGLIVGGAGT
jgi:hypothetical protein